MIALFRPDRTLARIQAELRYKVFGNLGFFDAVYDPLKPFGL